MKPRSSMGWVRGVIRFETWRWRLKPVRKHSPTNSNQGQTRELRGIDSRALLQSLSSFVAIRGPILFNQSRRDRSCWPSLLTELRSRFSVASSKAENFRVHDCRWGSERPLSFLLPSQASSSLVGMERNSTNSTDTGKQRQPHRRRLCSIPSFSESSSVTTPKVRNKFFFFLLFPFLFKD